MRIVLDTNILVSALIEGRGPSALLFDAWLDEVFELVTSTAQLTELKDVLERARIQERIRPAEAEKLVELIGAEAVVFESIPTNVDLSPDPADNVIIATAIAGNASLIVSGDKKHMLRLGDAAGIRSSRHATQSTVFVSDRMISEEGFPWAGSRAGARF